MNQETTRGLVDTHWQTDILPTLSRYIAIPNQSPLFDPDWRQNGHMQRAVTLAHDWATRQELRGATIEVQEIEGRTPLLFIEVPGSGPSNVLMYGHLDKQPPMTGWEKGLDPWTPILRDGKLYGRGGADDGYAVFAAVSAIRAAEQQNVAHSRIVIIIECCEESGSTDLPAHIELLAARIGDPRLVICLDSGCGNYEQLWMTTSLRGSIVGNLTVEVLSEGVHSGDASGIVPSSFRILRTLLDRLEDSRTGRVIPEWLWVEVPPNRMAEIRETARILGDEVFDKFPWLPGMQPVSRDPVELLLNRNWRPALAFTGQSGMPDLVQGGNVLRPQTSIKLSLRLPPTLNADKLDQKLKEILESDPPYGARVTFEAEKGGSGWQTPPIAPWLLESVDRSSRAFFGKPATTFAEGGSIPFMGMLGQRFPHAQFLITGILGPHSNAHGPNEFLHIQSVQNLTACIAQVIADERNA
jgi:acetylornithine deacetylase/succinyl-diaminopimelate desuccinylase-like protein